MSKTGDDLGPNSDPYTEPEYGIIAGNYDSHSNVWHIGMVSSLPPLPFPLEQKMIVWYRGLSFVGATNHTYWKYRLRLGLPSTIDHALSPLP